MARTPMTDEEFFHDTYTLCDECGAEVPYGGWPFCASEANPEGHTRGTYSWHFATEPDPGR